MKSVSRNRFFLCFRPVPIDVVLEPKQGCPDDIIGEDKGGITDSSSRMKSSGSQTDLLCPFLTKRTVSRIFKAILRRSVRGTKGSRRRSCPATGAFRPFEAKHSSSSLLVVRVDSIDHQDDQEVKSNSSTRASSCSSTASRSSSETSRPLHVIKDSKVIVMEHPCENKCNTYLYLMSLAITIFGGRACGILFTSIWMYLSFRRRLNEDKRRQEKGRRRLLEGSRVGSVIATGGGS